MMSIALSEKLHITCEIDNLSTNLALVSKCLLRRAHAGAIVFLRRACAGANLFCDEAYLNTIIFSVSILLMRLLFFVMLSRLRKDYLLLT